MSTTDEEHHSCKIVGISGSLRSGSYTTLAVALALKGAKELKCQTKLINLRDYHLVFCDGKDDESRYPEDVFKLRKEVQQAKGIILGTPEYHGSFSGVLKNALDLMGFEEFEGKMIGLVGVSGGPMGAFTGLTDLRSVGRALHAWVIPEQASIPEAWKVFDAGGAIKDRNLEQRLLEVGRQVARFACLHSAERAMEFLKNWECAPVNPGGAAKAL